MKRRDLLIAAGVLGAVFGGLPMVRRYLSGFDFAPLRGFDGFRRLEQGPITSFPSFLLGIDSLTPDQLRDRQAVEADPCGYLFGGPGVSGGNQLPIAIFSDYFCPYCAVLSRRLIRLQHQRSNIRLIVHELPLLGPQSLRIAKVALAAGLQGKHLSAHIRLTDRMLPPGPVALGALAEDLGLDAEQLARDVEGPEVAAQLRITAALGTALGIVGTPGTMIGRTLVIGAISQHDIERLIDLELSDPGETCG